MEYVVLLALSTFYYEYETHALDCLVFFGCCLAGACLTTLLPEVKGRDPDLIDAEEIRAAREKRRLN